MYAFSPAKCEAAFRNLQWLNAAPILLNLLLCCLRIWPATCPLVSPIGPPIIFCVSAVESVSLLFIPNGVEDFLEAHLPE